MPADAPDAHKTITSHRHGQTAIRFRDIEAIEDWEDVRRALGYDLPVRPLGGAVDHCAHPDPDEWADNQRAALARGGAHAQAVATFFARNAPATTAPAGEETPVATAIDTEPAFNPTYQLGQFCAEIENRLEKSEKNLVVLFYSRMSKHNLRVAPRAQFQSEWESFTNAARS